MVMSVNNRNRLLALARFFDRKAAAIRAYVKRETPKRGPRLKSVEDSKAAA